MSIIILQIQQGTNAGSKQCLYHIWRELDYLRGKSRYAARYTEEWSKIKKSEEDKPSDAA